MTDEEKSGHEDARDERAQADPGPLREPARRRSAEDEPYVASEVDDIGEDDGDHHRRTMRHALQVAADAT
jgi:hypothetical protein